MENNPPVQLEELNFYSQGFGARRIRWCPEQRHVVHGRLREGEVGRTPTSDELRDFAMILDNIDVWSWKECYNPGVICGTPFDLSIAVAGRQVSTGGNLAGDESPSNWSLFDRAMSALAGYRLFGPEESVHDLYRLSECVRATISEPEEVPDLVKTLIEDRIPIGSTLYELITRLGPRAHLLVPVLAENLSREHLFASGLARIGPAASAALPQLIALAQSPNSGSVDAVAAIAAIGPETPGVVSALEEIARHGPSSLRLKAIEALCSRPETCAELWDILGVALNNPDPSLREGTARSLRLLRGAAVVPALCRCVQDPERSVREQAVYSLCAIGKEARDALPLLLESLSDSDPSIRSAVVSTLRCIASPADVLPSIRSMLSDADKQVRETSAYTLQRMGPSAEDAIPDLLDALQEEFALPYIEALEHVSTDVDKTITGIARLLESDQSRVRQNALLAIRRVGGTSPRCVRIICSALKDSDSEVRNSAAGNLYELPAEVAPLAIPALSRAVYDPLVRANAANALDSIGIADPEAVAALSAVLNSINECQPGDVGLYCVARALARLSPEFRAQLAPETIQSLERFG